jgi:hypothetical protein
VADAVSEQPPRKVGVERPLARELEHPGAAELRHLLVARHPPEQVVDPLGDRPRRIAVERLADLGDGHPAPPSGRQDPRTTSRVGSIRWVTRS